MLRALIEKKEGSSVTVITTMDAFLDGLPHPGEIRAARICAAGGDVMDLTEFEGRLASMGYERESQIEGPGQFAVRGGIVDVFPLTEELPVRIELWGDEIDSIRSFDVESQRSVENLSEITIYPASENWADGLKTVSFLEYFPKDKTLLFLMSRIVFRRWRKRWNRSTSTAGRTGLRREWTKPVKSSLKCSRQKTLSAG